MNEDEFPYLQKMQSLEGDGMYEARTNDLLICTKARLPHPKHQAKEEPRAATHGGKFWQNPSSPSAVYRRSLRLRHERV
ncbi:MAG: hypothetical protein JO025_13015 [Verrucomicrobia bacterium]|nr:hypothetical protein [Verrucomicrobiota bacterium]